MSFKRFVETGRVVYVVNGENKGKLCSIVDIIDQTRVLVDGPLTGVPRQGIRINQINLTKFLLNFPRTGGTGVVRKAWKKAKIDERWRKSIWAKNLVNKQRRLAMTDFDRFKLKFAVSKRNKIRSDAFFVLRKQAYRENALYGMKKAKKTELMKERTKAKIAAKQARRTERRSKLSDEIKAKFAKRTEKPKPVKPKAKPAAKPAPKGEPKAAKPATKPAAKEAKSAGKEAPKK